jgi:hypothetical protein
MAKSLEKIIIDYLDTQDTPYIIVDGEIINIIPYNILTGDKNNNELYFVHVTHFINETDETDETNDKSLYSTAYVTPPDPDGCAYINFIDVPVFCRGNRIASKLLSAIESWCREKKASLIMLENDTDINEETGLPSTLYERAGYHYTHHMIYDEESKKNKLTDSEMEKVLTIGGSHSENCFLNEGKVTEQEIHREGSNKHEDEHKEQHEDEKKIQKKRKIEKMKKALDITDVNITNIIGHLYDNVKTRLQIKNEQEQERRGEKRKASFKRTKKSVRKISRKNKSPKRTKKSVRKISRKNKSPIRTKKSVRKISRKNKSPIRKVKKALINRIKSK